MPGPERRSRGRSTRTSKPYSSTSRPQRPGSQDSTQSSWFSSISNLIFGPSHQDRESATYPPSSSEEEVEDDEDDVQGPHITPTDSRRDVAYSSGPSFHRPPASESTQESNVSASGPRPEIAAPSLAQPSATSSRVAQVRSFFENKGESPLNEVEREGLLTIIAQAELSRPAQQHAPFRFASATPSSRDTSPVASNSKRLSKNPNSILKYSGSGSSRVKNRYASPSFGSASPARSTTMRVSSGTDEGWGSKRRKTSTFTHSTTTNASSTSSSNVNSAEISFSTPPPPPRASAPDPSPNRVREAKGRVVPGGDSSSSTSSSKVTQPVQKLPHPFHHRSPSPKQLPVAPLFAVSMIGIPQTQPKQPSPLRQTFVAHSSPSSSSEMQDEPPKKQTEAAKYMASLISSLDEPKKKTKEEIRNPYEEVNPGGKRKRAKILPQPKKKKVEQGKKKTKEIDAEVDDSTNDQEGAGESVPRTRSQVSNQKLVEVSVPKGSKRAKPPASMITTSKPEENSSTRRSPRLSPTSLPAAQSFSALGAPSGLSPSKKSKVKSIEVVDDDEEVDQLSDNDNEGGSPSKKPKLGAPLFGAGSTKPNGIGLGKPQALLSSQPTEGMNARSDLSKSDNILPAASSGDSSFGKPSSGTSLFSAFGTKPSDSIFGSSDPPSSISLFGSKPTDSSATSPFSTTSNTPSSLFGGPAPLSTSLFTPKPHIEEEPPKQVSAFASPPKAISPTKVPSMFASSQPKEPSKLRQSFAAEANTSQAISRSSSPQELSVITFVADDEARTQALTMSHESLPSFDFTSIQLVQADGEDKDIMAEVLKMKREDLPKFEFRKEQLDNGAAALSLPAVSGSTLTSAPPSAFNWAAAGMKPPVGPSLTEWKCGMCGCVNKDEGKTKDKCGICEENRVKLPTPPASEKTPATTASTASFNWSAAGMIPPPTPSAGQWKCSLCECMNNQEKTQCGVCEAMRTVPSSPVGEIFGH